MDKLSSLLLNYSQRDMPQLGGDFLPDPTVTTEANCAARRPPLLPIQNSLNVEYGLQNEEIDGDALSLRVTDSERRNSGILNDSDMNSVISSHSTSLSRNEKNVTDTRFSRYMAVCEEVVNKSLLNMFGEDAQTKAQKSAVGIILNDAQKNILSQSYGIANPEKLSSYKESYRYDFPIHETCEDWFKVPQLDDTVESLLIKKFGHKAAFESNHSKAFQNIKHLVVLRLP